MKTSLKLFVLLMTLVGGIYPVVLSLFSAILFPFQANGSLLSYEGRIVGSKWMGQYFDHPGYFWGRPSMRLYQDDSMNAADVSWLGNERWSQLALQQQQKFRNANIPLELQYPSASALDPHVSIPAIHIQLKRVAQTRHLSVNTLKEWVSHFEEEPLWGFWGMPRVNVLVLNLAMDEKWGPP